jgi:serine O-acetyltransferase
VNVSSQQDGATELEWEPQVTVPELSFAELVWSDYRRRGADLPEPAWRAALLFLPRMLFNPSLQLALLVRIAQRGPRLVQWPVRWLQVTLFSSEIYWFNRPEGIQLGPGVSFPHPTGIIIGPGTRIGASATIYHNANIGSDRHFTSSSSNRRVPVLEDRVIVYGYSAIQGPFRVGHDAAIGGHVLLGENVPPGALKTRNRLWPAGQWENERRPTA